MNDSEAIADSDNDNNKGTENGNETNSDDEFLQPTLDDEFDHQKYALGKIGIFIGDLIQFGLLRKEAIDSDRFKDVKFLDTELLPMNTTWLVQRTASNGRINYIEKHVLNF